jgi:sporulation integral membrane protein YlbJ
MKMKVKIINLLVIISCLIVLFEVIFNRIIVFDTISYSLNMWINSIIPSLAPFFIISDILINYNITNYIPKFIRKFLTKLFNVSDNVLTIFFLSIVSGFPTSARNVKTMYEMGIITNKEASHALTFTHFSNPLFILGTVSVFFLHNDTYGLIILISHYISNIILGIILRKYNTISKINYNNQKQTKKIFSNIFINSIKKSIDTLLMILGTLTCFLVLSTIIINKINLNLYNSTILKGILEITMGLKSLANLNIPDIYKVVISSMFISFGGLSVHMQVLSFLVDTDISYKPFFISRIIHFTIAGIISYLLFIIII